MTVYVDNMRAKFGRMIMCHMIADTKEELLQMVDKIGVQRKWIQRENTPSEHFDISLEKKRLAIENGAVEITMMDLGRKINEKRGKIMLNAMFGTKRETREMEG